MIRNRLFLLTIFFIFQTRADVAEKLSENFEGSVLSVFGENLLNNSNNHLSVKEGVSETKAIKTDYVGYERGSKRVVVRHNIARSDFYSLSFAVRFCEGFDFVSGGKLHGLGSVKPITGGKLVTPNGWSAR
jgi:hypothetical protein